MLVVESDKADMDVESFDDGFLASILVKDGGIYNFIHKLFHFSFRKSIL